MTNYSKDTLSFFQQVYQIVRLIPKGRVTSYGAIAKALGSGKSSRMVGWAMNNSHNQKEYVPAHRVVNRIGLLTGKHHFETPIKMQELLEKEGIEVKCDKVINFKNIFWNPIGEININD
jgi:methylated-DNA-protein-cysteine methyltransferase-like protein